MKKINRITFSMIVGLLSMGCSESNPKLHNELRGNVSDVFSYLNQRGLTPAQLREDMDFDGDKVMDPYIQPMYRKGLLYHTKSRDAQPVEDSEIRWYLLRE